jgi:hypothetical protein
VFVVADLPALPKVDEFAFVLLAGVAMILILALAWSTPQEGSPLVDDTTFSLTMKPGDTQTFDFVVKGKTTLTAVNLTAAGEIASWIKFNKNNFDVREQATVVATVKAPLNITNGLYTGRVTITGIGGKDTFSVNIAISDRTGNTTSKKILDLGQFTVSYAKGTDTLGSKRDVTVWGGYLSSTPVTFSGTASESKLAIAKAASIDLVIGETNGAGNLIVVFNGNEIYNGAAGEGTLSIPLNASDVKATNVVTIRAAPPGLAFWSSTTYGLQSAELTLSYDNVSPQTFNFTMSADQITNFKRFDLFYVVQDDTAIPVPEMKIKINNQIVFWKTPPYVSKFLDTTFKEDMFGNKLNLNDGDNTITFSFDENAFYSVSDATLTIEYYG